MPAFPDIDDVIRAAEGLGFPLSRDEAALFQQRLAGQLDAIERFVADHRTRRASLPATAARDPGYRPDEAEDPLRAWMWKCRIAGAAHGLLEGLTVSFKDHTAVAGIPCTFGAKALEGFVPDFDATIVTRILAAGATITGKNSLNGLTGGRGYGGGVGDYDRPLNPVDQDHVSGGSSSGSAVAVAAGEVDISFGGDQGGSIRSPASWCGVVGLKPTFGLVSHFGVGFGSEPSLDHVGPIARTVRDAALALEAVAGRDPLDPRQDASVPERYDIMATLAVGVKGLTIGLLEEGFDASTDDGVRRAVLNAAGVLEGLGAKVRTVSVPSHDLANQACAALAAEGALSIFQVGFLGAFARTIYPVGMVEALARFHRAEAAALSPTKKLSLLLGAFSRDRLDGAAYATAQNIRPRLKAAYDDALAGVDILVTPTSPSVAPRWKQPPSDRLSALKDALSPMDYIRHRRPFNFTGHPALTVPCGMSGGLPVGLQLIGRFYDDRLLLQAAAAYEAAAGRNP